MNASPKGSPVLGPCYLPALPQATPKPPSLGPPVAEGVFVADNVDSYKDNEDTGKTSFPPPQKVPL